jgi:hypothetical protein
MVLQGFQKNTSSHCSTLPSHQNQYQMNPNYVIVVKQDLDKLLTIGFVDVMEKVTWLLLILVVPKKMLSCAFASISRY